mmetsp:Transcript_46726/g.69102  ORF Transcript_46726/g.69102 Transcript_46726/m.69102 type:complete len:207 (+) Transcript_46726:1230-1850(+)
MFATKFYCTECQILRRRRVTNKHNFLPLDVLFKIFCSLACMHDFAAEFGHQLKDIGRFFWCAIDPPCPDDAIKFVGFSFSFFVILHCYSELLCRGIELNILHSMIELDTIQRSICTIPGNEVLQHVFTGNVSRGGLLEVFIPSVVEILHQFLSLVAPQVVIHYSLILGFRSRFIILGNIPPNTTSGLCTFITGNFWQCFVFWRFRV